MLFSSLAAISAATAAVEGGERYALLVGISTYEQWDPLVNPVPDVRMLAHELRQHYGFLAEVLENPDRKAILAHLRRYAEGVCTPDDQLWVVFAGHGTYDEVTDIGYLAARDSESRRRDPNFTSLISYPLLLALLDNLPCQEVFLVVDACYSGALADTGSEEGRSGGGGIRRFLTSGGKEYVPDGDPDRHTPFMRHLLAGLRSVGGRDTLSVDDLQETFMARVEPRPRWGRFGSGGGRSFALTPRGAATTAGDRPPVSASSGSVSSSSTAAPPAPAPGSRLRAEAGQLSEAELERVFELKELYDSTWNPEGDFSNQFRTQSAGLWEVVIDLESRLVWQKSGSAARMTRDEAEAYVRQLNQERHGGFGDWRLPTLEELASILEPQRLADDLFIYPYFDTEQETCWSADRDRASGQPYFVSFNAGRAVLAYGNRTAFVRAVRAQ